MVFFLIKMLIFTVTITIINQIHFNLASNLDYTNQGLFHSKLFNSINSWLIPNGHHWNQCTILIVESITGANANINNNDEVITFETLNMSTIIISKNFEAKLNLTVPEILPFQFHQHFSSPCTIAFYFTPIQNFKYFPNDFIHNLPGGTFNSFHFIFVQEDTNIFKNRSISIENYEAFKSRLFKEPLNFNNVEKSNEFHYLRQLHHLLILERIESIMLDFDQNSTKSTLSLHTFNLWFNKTIELSFSSDNLFPNKWHNLYGETLIIASTPETNSKILTEYIRTKEIKSGGYSASGVYEMLSYFNATPSFTSKTPIFGYQTSNGSWVGIIGEVLNGHAHLAFGIGLTHERAQVIEYGHVYHYDRLIFITALPQQLTSSSGSLDFLSRPLHGTVWINIGLIFLGIYLLLLGKKYLETYASGLKQKLNLNTYVVLFNFLFRPIFDQPNENARLLAKASDALSRFLYSLWLIAIIVLTCAYKSSFISILLAPTTIHPPKTFAEVASASNYKIGAVLYNESFIGANFLLLNNKVGEEVRKRVKGYSLFTSDYYLPVENLENHQICMTISAYLELGAAYYLTDTNGQPLYKLSDDPLFPVSASVAIPKSFPHLKPSLDTIIDRFFDTGVLREFYSQEKKFKAREGRRLAKEIRPKRNEIKSDQGLHHFLTLLGLGYVIATGVFILEWNYGYVFVKLIKWKNKMV